MIGGKNIRIVNWNAIKENYGVIGSNLWNFEQIDENLSSTGD